MKKLPIRETRNIKDDRRSPSPERFGSSSDEEGERFEEEVPPSMKDMSQKKSLKDRGLEITEDDLKSLK